MTERVKSLGGSCAIESGLNEGATIRIEIPLQHEKTVLKDTFSDDVLKAFQKAREGRPYLSHDLASEVVMEARGTTNPLKAHDGARSPN